MSEQPDRLSDRPDDAPPSRAVVDDVLRWLRIGGGIFLRAEFRAPWAYESPTSSQMLAVLKPGGRRLILFHVIAEGRCILRLPDGACAELAAGDVIILPYGHQHRVASALDVEPVDITTLVPPPPWTTMPVIRRCPGG